MTGFETGQYLNAVLVVALIARLIWLRLFAVYLALSFFLIFEIFQSFAFIFISSSFKNHVDYRLIWMTFRLITWVLMLSTVYSILGKVLKSLPGILKISQHILNIVFGLAVVGGIISVIPEYNASSAATSDVGIARATIIMIVSERAITMSAFIALLAILLFVVWFPVQLPRNLVVFSAGLVVYLGLKTFLLLARTYVFRASDQTLDGINYAIMALLALCFVCWSTLIGKAGEKATTRIGHIWRTADQDRLMDQLKTMNSSLLRSRS